MSIRIRCPHCQATLVVKEALIAGGIRCVRCHQPLPVGAEPQPTGEPAMPHARKTLSDEDVLEFIGSPKS
jgi:predicted Zn finger-like uncharacterized protein